MKRSKLSRIHVLHVMAALAASVVGTLSSGCGGASPRADEARATATPAAGSGGQSAADARVSSAATARVEGDFHAVLPTAVTSFGAASANGALYVLGGYHGTPHAYVPEDQSGAFSRLDLSRTGASWETLPEIAPAQSIALVAHGARVCRTGGMRAVRENERVRLRSIDEAGCFDPARGSWEALPSLPSPRSSHEAAVVGDTLVVAGGWALEGEAPGTFARSWLALDLAHPERGWREAEAPFARRGLGVASLGESVIVVGGLDEAGEISSRVDVLDVARGTWSRGPDFPGDAFGVAIERAGDRVIASGRDGVVWSWRGGDDAWQRVGTMMFPRFFHQLVARGDDEVIAIGGIRGMVDAPRTAHVEAIALSPRTSPRVTVLTIDSPMRAKNRQGLFVHDDALHFFGGNVSLEQHDFEPQHFVAEHHALDLPSLSWTRRADYPFSRQTIQTVAVEDRGIAIGGFGHEGTTPSTGQARTQAEAFTYSFDEDRWTPWSALPVTRSQFGLVADGEGALWALGGLDYDPAREGEDAFRHLTEIVRADASTGEWQDAGVAMQGARRAFGGARIGDVMYVVGGMRGEFQLVEDCQALDLRARAWRTITCPRTPRLNPQLVAIGDRLYLVGGTSRGEGGLAADRTIEVYDPQRDAWSVLIEDLPIEPKHLRAFELRGRLVLVSTHDAEPVARVAVVTLPE
ncbi:Kelch repeat-containing protein [Sandaracinus amylolyticus]|uniref:Kelch repeat-containing protein n=1 Tax=Sandaracinus amylolyticus TaxID=927083 RepID=UPI00147048E5|nr:kelch repeat-containing protein [Sandaracinus amylolyticus]